MRRFDKFLRFGLFLSISLLISFPSMANDWSQASREHAKALDQESQNYSDPFEHAVRAQALGWFWEPIPDPPGSRVHGLRLKGHERLLNVRIYEPLQILQRLEGDPLLEKSPEIIVLLPGLFQNTNLGADLIEQSIWEFASMGYWVLAFPGPWSYDWRASRPSSPAGDIVAEARTILNGIDEIFKTEWAPAQKRNPTVHILGFSYGAFQAAVVRALDGEAGSRRFNGSVTLLNPPPHLTIAYMTLDRLLDESENLFWDGRCEWSGALLSKESLSLLREPSGQNCAKAWFSWLGFQKPLVRLAHYDRFQSITQSQWRAHAAFRFRDYIRLNQLETRLAEEQNRLFAWLEKTHAKASWRLLTTRDDVLSQGYPANSQTLELDKGGHLGYTSNKSWGSFLRSTFVPPPQ